ncbi:hypothetical protein I0C86_19535 [Plantactinospora sp. S1510]|uniref:Phage holin family protein n=1 Tax=Plantactinospora alkalitolerans TaxID=2789879 RepID=A0ABS0GY51_9ACTN|nr:hypothetical protein [Plantactinospora alkalitolerans]MBF9131135.1 hypothetical protein [Plantactinospora alkalitolerans]
MSYGDAPASQERHRPRALKIGAGLLAIVGLLGVGRVAYGVLVNLAQDDWSSGARAVFLVLNAIVLVFALLVLVLAHQVWHGRLWAWIGSLVMLPFTILFGGLLLLITVLHGGVPLAGAGVVAASVAALLALTGPRMARGYFLRKPAPATSTRPEVVVVEWPPLTAPPVGEKP